MSLGLSESFLPQYEREMTNTRKTLERIPSDRLDWRPHEKSMDFRGLATHLATLPRWAVLAIEEDSFDMTPVGAEPPRTEPVGSSQEALDRFDEHVGGARAAIARSRDEHLLAPWTLLAGGNPVFTIPRIEVLRTMVLSHIVHHRAQLGVYLRLNEIPVPPVYGSSADEAGR